MVRAPGTATAAPHVGALTPGERVEHTAVGYDDEPERAGVAPAEAGPVRRPARERGQLPGERTLCRPGHRRHPPTCTAVEPA